MYTRMHIYVYTCTLRHTYMHLAQRRDTKKRPHRISTVEAAVRPMQPKSMVLALRYPFLLQPLPQLHLLPEVADQAQQYWVFSRGQHSNTEVGRGEVSWPRSQYNKCLDRDSGLPF